jgi:hypothetical protein
LIFDLIVCSFDFKDEYENFVGHVWLR